MTDDRRPGTLAVLATLYRGFWRLQLESTRRVFPFHLVAASLVLAGSVGAGFHELGLVIFGVIALSTICFIGSGTALRRLSAVSTRGKDVPLLATLGFALGRWYRKLRHSE